MPRVSSQTIVGRDEPLRLLDDLLAAAQLGQPQVVLLAGEAGVGKTRLAQELEGHAREHGFLVLHGESIEFGGEAFPFAPLVAALADLDEELPSLHSSGHLGKARLCELVLNLLGERGPVLLVVEDLHWADRSTRDFLAFVARRLRDERLIVAATYRTGELPRSHPLRRLLTEMGRRPVVTRVDLSPLDRDAVSLQLEAIAGGPVATRLADELHARSGGNPFFVEELFAARRDDLVPDTVADTVLARVQRLSPEAQRLLTVLAAAGGPADHAVLEPSVPELGTALREARDAGLVIETDGAVSLRHGLIGEVIYGSLVAGERAELHRALAEALAAEGASAARLADQWQRAGDPDAALGASVAAAVEAEAVYAYPEAREHLERALELWDVAKVRPGVDRVELLSRAAQAARFDGDRERALALGRDALERLDVDRRAHTGGAPVRAPRRVPVVGRPRRARVLRAGAGAPARRAGSGALAPARGAGSRPDGPAPLGGGAGLLRGRARAGPRRGGAHARPRARLPRRRRRGRARGAPGARGGAARRGHGARVRAPRRAPAPGRAARRRAGGDGRPASALAARLGMRGTFGHFMFVNAADDLLRLGRWDEAEARLQEAERMDLGVTAAAMHGATAGHLHALRGEDVPARRHLERALELAGEGLPGEFVVPIRSAWAALALAAGDPDEARRHVDAGFAAVGDDRDPLYTPALHWLGVRAEADLARASDVADALLADLDRLLADGAAVPDALAHRATAAAELSRARERPEPALWQQAADAWAALAEPYPTAYARFRGAEATADRGRLARYGRLTAAGGERDRRGARRPSAARAGPGSGPSRASAARRTARAGGRAS